MPALAHRLKGFLGQCLFFALFLQIAFYFGISSLSTGLRLTTVPSHAEKTLAECRALNARPGPPPTFSKRSISDRYEPGSPAVYIHNANIWTGRDNGLESFKGDILVDQGIIQAVGQQINASILETYHNLVMHDAEGAWVTPGIIDLHAHLAIDPSPSLDGASDANSLRGLVLPWLRAIDGLNTHDESFRHSISGGVTTSLILPGSADSIGGQAFVIKLRPTSSRSSTSLLLEPPYGLNGSGSQTDSPPRWRHIKHACGENPARVYSATRMDTAWAMRSAYEKARQIMVKQDAYCSQALEGNWYGLGELPKDLQWEALVDVLRGKVKVQTHCYEAVDIDAFVRLSNEFQFPVAAFHHAHEAWLVPEVLKQSYGKPPAIAMFAAFSRYKREAYRHSEFGPRILHDNGIKVVMKSDHPAIQSRYLLHEAQQAHYYGLPSHVALSSVISTPAEVLGLEHRIGFIQDGYDADIAIWDSHPLSLGATPKQVYIDGIAQLETPYTLSKDASLQVPPHTPNFDVDAEQAIKYEGLPPLNGEKTSGLVIFTNVSHIWVKGENEIEMLDLQNDPGVVVVREGKIICQGTLGSACMEFSVNEDAMIVDIPGGAISPALVSFGSQLGLQDIALEVSTTDGVVHDPLTATTLSFLGEGSVIRAVDGLQYGTRDALLAYRAGVTSAITPPFSAGFFAGLATSFSTGAAHKLEHGAVLQEVTSLHVAITHGIGPSVSTQIAALRRLLLNPIDGDMAKWSEKVTKGSIPLVVSVQNADIIASLLQLKQEVEDIKGHAIRLTLNGAAEAHILAKELAEANVGVIITPPRSFPYTWAGKRILHGPPLTAGNTIDVLVAHNVTAGLGPQGVSGEAIISTWATRNLRFDAAWAALNSDGKIAKKDALAMASSNIERLLGVNKDARNTDLVVTSGGDLFSFESKVLAVISPRRKVTDLFL